MAWPKSVGKGVADYIEEATTPVRRESFQEKLEGFLKLHKLTQNVDADAIDALFRISDEYLRTLGAIGKMEKDRLREDWGKRRKLTGSIDHQLQKVLTVLTTKAKHEEWPLTSALAASILGRVVSLQKRVRKELSEIEEHERISRSMLRKLSRKHLREEYVGELDRYLERTFPSSKGRNVVITGVMTAARCFSETDLKNDAMARIPMARSRARAYITKEYKEKGIELSHTFKSYAAPLQKVNSANLKAIKSNPKRRGKPK